jgi:iron complex outermembrane receptor protein/vitamin B12 transporter
MRRTGLTTHVLPGLAALTASFAIQAQPETENIVVVGSRLASDGFGPRNVVALDSNDIGRSVPGDTEQLLRGLPGVSLFRPGGAGGVSELFVRGGESNFTAVYVDGVRLNDTTNTRGGSFDFSMLPVIGIERLELAPGAMSAIYGSDTMAGVIRVETAWPDAREWRARAELGSQSDSRLGLGTAFALGDAVVLGLTGSAADAGDEVEGATLETTGLGARLTVDRRSGTPWTFVARAVERDRTSFPEVSGGPLYAVLRELETAESEQIAISANTRWDFSDAWNAELTLSHAGTEDDFRSPPIAPGTLDGQPAFTTQTDFDRTEALLVNRYRFGPALAGAFGVDFVTEEGRDDGAIDFGGPPVPAAYALDRDIRSAFAELGRNFGSGFIGSLAVRADRAGDRSEVSGRIDLSKSLTGIDGRAWASVAEGFKLPSFFALGNPLYGNPALLPEEVRSVELGFEQAPTAGVGYSVSVFRSAYENLIDFDFDTFTSVNRATVDIDGVQATLALAPSAAWTITLDATVLSIEPGTGASTLPRRPEQIAGITIDRSFGRGWSLATSARYVGNRTISSIPTGTIEDGGYGLASATLRRVGDDGLIWWIAADNLFDTEYRHAPGFPSPGARLRLGVEIAR